MYPVFCRYLLSDTAVHPGTRISHQRVERCAVIDCVSSVRTILTAMGDQHGSFFGKNVNVVSVNAHQDILMAVLWSGGVVMLAIQADFPIAICFQVFIPANSKRLSR